MIRRLSIAATIAISALTLSGCVSDYAYRDGPGDYYYGQPTVDYNYYGAPYGGVGYGGYGGGYYGGIGYGSGYYGGGGYGYPYGYGNTYVYPRYYGGRNYRDRDRDGHGRPHNNNGGGPNYNRDARGSDKIPGILERNSRVDGQARNDRDSGRLRYRSPDSQGQRISQPQGVLGPTDGPRSREALQGRQQRSFPAQQSRASQPTRSAPVQRSAPPASSNSQRGRGDRGRMSER